MIKFEDLALEKCADGLLPVIVQEQSTRQVLMLGYMNAEALHKTQKEERVTFFSRTKNRLWTKGETSGNFLKVVSMHVDCDQDALLVRVIPTGPTCHTGSKNCFDTRPTEGFVGELQRVIQERHLAMPEDSYTTRLFNKGVNKIAQKVGEEAVETVIEAVDNNKGAMLYEASDLVYHLLVLLESMDCSISDIEAELASRHK